jgi:hypothetical protein
MIEKFSNFEEWRKAGLHLTRCCIRVLSILTLTFIAIGANPSSLVQAAHANGYFNFLPVIIPSAAYVCVDQTITLKVQILVQLNNEAGDTGVRFGEVRGSIVTADILAGGGSITPASGRLGDPRDLNPNSATFTFKAGGMPGSTKFLFHSRVSSFYLGNGPLQENANDNRDVVGHAEIDVRRCSYKVNMLQVLSIAGVMQVIGTADEIELTADSATHFSGNTRLSFATQIFLQNLQCAVLGGWKPGGITLTVTNSNVTYTADLTGDTLYLTPAVQPYTATSIEKCSGFSFTTPSGNSSQPVTLKFPSSGGVALIQSPRAVTTIIVERVSVP